MKLTDWLKSKLAVSTSGESASIQDPPAAVSRTVTAEELEEDRLLEADWARENARSRREMENSPRIIEQSDWQMDGSGDTETRGYIGQERNGKYCYAYEVSRQGGDDGEYDGIPWEGSFDTLSEARAALGKREDRHNERADRVGQAWEDRQIAEYVAEKEIPLAQTKRREYGEHLEDERIERAIDLRLDRAMEVREKLEEAALAQKNQDFAYVMKELKKGVPAPEVQAALAKDSRNRKADSDYYAAGLVDKAVCRIADERQRARSHSRGI